MKQGKSNVPSLNRPPSTLMKEVALPIHVPRHLITYIATVKGEAKQTSKILGMKEFQRYNNASKLSKSQEDDGSHMRSTSRESTRLSQMGSGRGSREPSVLKDLILPELRGTPVKVPEKSRMLDRQLHTIDEGRSSSR
jgi:hypothetical protein